MGLFYEGGIPLGFITDHVRANKVERTDLIAWPSQFAAPDEPKDDIRT